MKDVTLSPLTLRYSRIVLKEAVLSRILKLQHFI